MCSWRCQSRMLRRTMERSARSQLETIRSPVSAGEHELIDRAVPLEEAGQSRNASEWRPASRKSPTDCVWSIVWILAVSSIQQPMT